MLTEESPIYLRKKNRTMIFTRKSNAAKISSAPTHVQIHTQKEKKWI